MVPGLSLEPNSCRVKTDMVYPQIFIFLLRVIFLRAFEQPQSAHKKKLSFPEVSRSWRTQDRIEQNRGSMDRLTQILHREILSLEGNLMFHNTISSKLEAQ